MKKKPHTLDSSWLSGKWTLADGTEVEVNTKLPYFAYGDFFAQGDNAKAIIDEIHDIWANTHHTQLVACMVWAEHNL